MPTISINTAKSPHLYVSSSTGILPAEAAYLSTLIPLEWEEQIAVLLGIERAACNHRVALTQAWRIEAQEFITQAHENLRTTHPELYI